MTLKAHQIAKYIIQPTLLKMQLHSRSAENLLLGTIAHESLMGTYFKQQYGPALGIFQMEPATHDDVWQNVLKYNEPLRMKVEQFLSPHFIPLEQLTWNLGYATAMARAQYYRFAEALPAYNDPVALAKYYKTYWNTEEGKATVEQFLEAYKKYIL